MRGTVILHRRNRIDEPFKEQKRLDIFHILRIFASVDSVGFGGKARRENDAEGT